MRGQLCEGECLTVAAVVAAVVWEAAVVVDVAAIVTQFVGGVTIYAAIAVTKVKFETSTLSSQETSKLKTEEFIKEIANVAK